MSVDSIPSQTSVFPISAHNNEFEKNVFLMINMLAMYLNDKINGNAKGIDKNEPFLHYLIHKNNNTLVKCLTDGGIDLNEKDNQTLLICAIEGNNKELTEILIEGGADV